MVFFLFLFRHYSNMAECFDQEEVQDIDSDGKRYCYLLLSLFSALLSSEISDLNEYLVDFTKPGDMLSSGVHPHKVGADHPRPSDESSNCHGNVTYCHVH